MKVIAVDDEQLALQALERALKEFAEFTQINVFRSPPKALEWLRNNQADIAFLDISMKQMNGLILAKNIKELCASCAIVFVTGYSEYALQAIQMHVSGYLLKPVRQRDIRQELDYILSLPSLQERGSNCIRVQCFGNFEVFADNEPMKFQYRKTKELLAYLVDRKGAWCTNGEIIAVLWEDQANAVKKSSYFRDLRADLMAAFKETGHENVIQKQRGMVAIVPDRMKCDYYDWTRGEIKAINAYKGEYLSQYSWGEFTLGGIEGHRHFPDTSCCNML